MPPEILFLEGARRFVFFMPYNNRRITLVYQKIDSGTRQIQKRRIFMIHSFLETAKGLSETKDFEAAKALIENSVQKSAKSCYGIALPERNTESGIYYAPHGT